jgi:hypothetical protein
MFLSGENIETQKKPKRLGYFSAYVQAIHSLRFRSVVSNSFRQIAQTFLQIGTIFHLVLL